MTMKFRFALPLILAALLPSLTGCFPVVATGVGAGVLMISDRRPSETYLADEGIEIRSSNRISEKFGDKVHVNITSYNRTVLLTGEVPDGAAKSEIEKIVTGVPNVKAIVNELSTAGKSTLGARSNDSYVTTKIKGRFIDANKFSPNHVKVVTEGGTAYLMGLVTQREADAAVEVARTTSGVLKVVRVMELISEEQARQIDARPAEDASDKKKSGQR